MLSRTLVPPPGLQQDHAEPMPCSGLAACPFQWPTPCFTFPRCLQVENEHVLKSMKACVSETLSTLGQHFGQLLELALTREVQVSEGLQSGEGWAEKLGQAGEVPKWLFLGDILLRAANPAHGRQPCQGQAEASPAVSSNLHFLEVRTVAQRQKRLTQGPTARQWQSLLSFSCTFRFAPLTLNLH